MTQVAGDHLTRTGSAEQRDIQPELRETGNLKTYKKNHIS
jgi:hypothetical protein